MKIVKLQYEHGKYGYPKCHECDPFLLPEFTKAKRIIQWINIDNVVISDYVCDKHAIEALDWAIKSLQETKEKIENENNI